MNGNISDSEALEWIETGVGQLWLNNNHSQIGWHYNEFAAIKFDMEGSDAEFRWSFVQPGAFVSAYIGVLDQRTTARAASKDRPHP